MTNSSRRLLFFVTASAVGLGLLVALLLLIAQPPRPVTSPTLTPSPTWTPVPRVVATVDDEPISFSEWQRAVALDSVLSQLVGQPAPSPEETLDRLINEQLVLQAAAKANIAEPDQSQAEAWLASFLAIRELEPAALEQALARVNLTRIDFLSEIIPRLLRIQAALEELSPEGNGDVWVADLQRRARVSVLEHLSTSRPPAAQPTAVSPQQTHSSIEPATRPSVGTQAPDFSLETTSGTTVRLTDLRGQTVILNFWASWCAPCRNELPLLQAAENDQLVVLGIGAGESFDTAIAFANELGLTGSLLIDQDGQTRNLYQVRGLPTSLFLNREGMIVARHVGPLNPENLQAYVAMSSAESATPTTSP